jgi:[ribosomal protein S5]-alanine N-acetyltransferase
MVELYTARLLLREFQSDDWPAVLAYQIDPRYLRYYAWAGRTAADVQRFVQMFIDQQHEEPRTRYQLALCRRESGDLIGNFGIRRPAAWSHDAEIGYELSPDHWGHGYATEAVGAILRFGFEDLGLHRIAAWTVADNAASARVLAKVGFTLEGRLRDRESFKGRYWDVLVFGILAEEWRRK